MMTLSQTAAAFIEQAEGDGVIFDSFAPVVVSGPEDIIARYAAIIAHLRDKAARHPHRPDFDRALAQVAGMRLGPQETELVRLVGKPGGMVWINASPFVFGRLEAVVPGVALVTVHPDPVLPTDPLARWQARTENTIPFTIGLIEPAPLDEVLSDGIGDLLGVRRRPDDDTTHRPRQERKERKAS